MGEGFMLDRVLIAIVGVFFAIFFFNLSKVTYKAVKAREYKKLFIGVCVVLFLVFLYWYANSKYSSPGEPCASYDMRGCTE